MSRRRTSVRIIPWLTSLSVATASGSAGSTKLGQPLPDSYLASERKSTVRQPTQRYCTGFLARGIRAGERSLGRLPPQHLVLLARQLSAPLLVGLANLLRHRLLLRSRLRRRGARRGPPRRARRSPARHPRPERRPGPPRAARSHLDLGTGHEPFVVEPVQQRPVVLGEPHDRRAGPGSRSTSAVELAVLGLLDRRVDRPAVRAPVGAPNRSRIRSIMSSLNVSASSSACSCDSAPV